jgi:hypothetical protein
MKRTYTYSSFAPLSVALAVLLVSGAFSHSFSQTVRSFEATPSGQEVRLEWTSATESGLMEYRLQRSFDGFRFHSLHAVAPTGSNSQYNYIDRDLFKGNLQTFYYRIQVVYSDDRSNYTNTEKVELSFSGIRRSWGSIKAMFR